MTEKERRKGGGGKLSRSETVTVRLDPKLRYMAELAARKQRRTLSSFIEWAIEDTLNRVVLEHGEIFSTSIADATDRLWDVDDADRFARLAFGYPDLLTYDEQVLWKLIRESGVLWRGRYTDFQWNWTVNVESLIIERLRKYWDIYNRVAKGEQTGDDLPKLQQKGKAEAQSSSDDFFEPDEARSCPF